MLKSRWKFSGNPNIPNIDAISGALITLSLTILILNSQCEEGARDGLDIWLKGITLDRLCIPITWYHPRIWPVWLFDSRIGSDLWIFMDFHICWRYFSRLWIMIWWLESRFLIGHDSNPSLKSLLLAYFGIRKSPTKHHHSKKP